MLTLALATTAFADPLQWASFEGSIPGNAVEVGVAWDRPVYVCRGQHEGGTLPGKLMGTTCSIGVGGKEVVLDRFEVLVHGPVVPQRKPPPPISPAMEGYWKGPGEVCVRIWDFSKSDKLVDIYGVGDALYYKGHLLLWVGGAWTEGRYLDDGGFLARGEYQRVSGCP